MVTERDGHWLTGLVDGEGCFFLSTFRTRGARGYDRKYRVLTFEFKLALRIDDLQTVRLARTILGVGTVSTVRRGDKAKGLSTSKNAKSLAVLTVYARTDISAVIEFFRRFTLRSKKARDFDVWARAFERLQKVTANTPLTAVSTGKVTRAAKTRRPAAGTPRRRFKTIPDALFEEMDGYARQLRTLRECHE